MAICRKCGRPIERSPSTGLWWPVDNVPPWLGHEPQEPRQDGHEDDGDTAA